MSATLIMPFSLVWLSPPWPIVALTVLVAPAAFLIYLVFCYVDYPKIQGIPEIPGGGLVAGHLYQLGADHATTCETWAARYGWPVFQIRMGYRRAVVLNTFEATREWIVKNQTATIDRPWFYTFHGIVSKTSAATIGTSPWDEKTKKQRRVVGSFTTGPSIQRMRSLMDMETCAAISGLYYDGKAGDKTIMPHVYQKRVALNIMTMFCYGTRFSSVENPMLLQILRDAQTIASFRSSNSNAQDFIPHLRYMGTNSRTQTATEVRGRRDKWLAEMLDAVRGELKPAGPSLGKSSVAGMMLGDSREGLTDLDIKTILGGLMSGGFETIFSTAIAAIGFLASPAGQQLQQDLYNDIMSVYQTPEEAFALCSVEEKSALVAGLVRETLRFYAPLKLLPARQTYKEFDYQGASVPKGVLVYINTQAANFDKAAYGADADCFRPSRWVDGSCQVPPPYHFAFGAGARMCTAVNFSNRVLYALLARIVISFRMVGDKSSPPNTDRLDYKADPAASTAIPADFQVRFVPRDLQALNSCLQNADESLKGFVTGDSAETLVRQS